MKETWDEIQEKIKADCLLAERLKAREQEELTIKERAILFQQLLEKRRKHFAAKRAEEKRNKPPTKAQQRSIMCTYLKNIEGWKIKDLKSKSFANIQELFDKAMKSSKRARDELEQESINKQKVDEDKETAKMYLVFSHMLKSFDREGLETLYKLVKSKYGSTRLVEDLDLVLYGYFKTMFNSHVEDQLMLLVYKLLLSVFRVNAASTKLQLLKRLRLLEDFLLSEKR
ncbi:hypothetical protein Tco_1035956 [Tanacetum coccineum]